jgi:putative restriction endonuclease
MDLFAQGSIEANLVELTPDLGELFSLYWVQAVRPDSRGNLALPFFHLRGDGFWHLVPRPGREEFLSCTHQIRSVNQLCDTVLGAKMDEELYVLLQADESRSLLRTVLIETYFAPELHSPLLELGLTNVGAFSYGQKLLEQALAPRIAEGIDDAEEVRAEVRDQGFRRAIVTAYDHRCALCGIRLLTSDGHTAVAAAHIVPWSISRNDHPRNGMALCRLCHWTFDEGLLGISTQYRVLASQQLRMGANVPGHLVTLEGREIIGPSEELLWPDLDALGWHRQHVYHAH